MMYRSLAASAWSSFSFTILIASAFLASSLASSAISFAFCSFSLAEMFIFACESMMELCIDVSSNYFLFLYYPDLMPLLKRDNVENHLYHNYFLSNLNGNVQRMPLILKLIKKVELLLILFIHVFSIHKGWNLILFLFNYRILVIRKSCLCMMTYSFILSLFCIFPILAAIQLPLRLKYVIFVTQ